jgi:phage baseplate assembly protein gpV
MEYDRAQHHWLLSVPSGGRIVLEIGPSKIEMTDAGIRLTAPRIDLN